MAIFAFILIIAIVFLAGAFVGMVMVVRIWESREAYSIWACDCNPDLDQDPGQEKVCNFFGTYEQARKASVRCAYSKCKTEIQEVLFKFDKEIKDVSDT